MARPKHRASYLVCPDSRDQDLPFTDFSDQKTLARLLRPRRIRRDPAAQVTARPALPSSAFSTRSRPDGDGATFTTKVDTARPAWSGRPKIAPSRFSRPRCRLRDFLDRGATKNQFLTTKAETARPRPNSLRPRRRRRNFPDQFDFCYQILVCQDFLYHFPCISRPS